jgi:hypothetical protein
MLDAMVLIQPGGALLLKIPDFHQQLWEWRDQQAPSREG